jgi:peptidoglycan hydrolase CwlO-like protein
MDKVIIFSIPAALYYFYRQYQKNIYNHKEYKNLTKNLKQEMAVINLTISKNITEFKDNINKLNNLLEKYKKEINELDT